MKYEAVIGLEVHVQLRTRSKMFCGCLNQYGAEPNTHTCPVCLGMPGALPVPNEEAIRLTILTGLMLNCRIDPVCKFDRKSYFYPDMPKNYQTSQYDMPLCIGGAVVLDKFAFPKDLQNEPEASANKSIRLVRIHLEEDVAKSTHFETHSGIDFNRAGTPLMEIVTEADISSAGEAFAFLSTLRQILTYGNVSDADMEKGQLRCDVNISVRPEGQKQFGTKCELKNLNSISGVRRAVEYEFERQIEVVSSGGTIVQETRRWDDPSGQTYTMRTKEDAHDYRYFPCPDLLPIRTDEALLPSAQKLLPELPRAKRERFEKELELTEYQAATLAADLPLCDFFERASEKSPHKEAIANLILNDFLATSPDTSAIATPPGHFAELAALIADGTISSKQGKQVFSEMLASGDSPQALVDKLGLKQVSDSSLIEKLCDEAIADNPDSVESFQSGNTKAINKLTGMVMKASKGQANPKLVSEILQKKLS